MRSSGSDSPSTNGCVKKALLPGTKHVSSHFTFFFAFVVVLALIGLAAWLVRRFAGNRLGANANRGRMPRLAVIDAAAVDGRRRLVLVRRDNIEHLLMIGGPTDIVVEPNIVRAMPGRDQAPRPSRRRRPSRRAHRAAARSPAGPTARRPDRHVRPCRTADARAAAAAGPPVLCRRSAPPGRRRRCPNERTRAAIRSDGRLRAGAAAAAGPSRRPDLRPRTDAVPSHLAQRADDAAAAAARAAEAHAAAAPARRSRAPAPPPPPAAAAPGAVRAPTRTSPRWRSGSKPHCAGPAG